MSALNKVWDGPPRIIIALDIGIKYTQVAYALLRTGEDISLRRVAQWPGREFPMRNGSVATALYYDSDNEVKAAGDETSLPDILDQAEDSGWKLVRHFPQQLYPPSHREHLPECETLPTGLSLLSVYAGYIKYLMNHARQNFINYTLDGENAWSIYSRGMTIAFTVPYSWSFKEHGFLRDAFLQADPEFMGSFRFVEQGEALIYGSMLDNDTGLATLRGLSSGSNVVMCNSQDAWSEIVTYRVDTHIPELPRFVPINGAVQAGWLTIVHAVKEYLKSTLGSHIADREEVDDYATKGAIDFEWKRTFSLFTIGKQYHIEIAGTRFHRPSINVRRGRMIVQSSDLKSSFDPCVNAIVEEFNKQVSTRDNVQLVITLGDLAESPYLKQTLAQSLEAIGMNCETYSSDLGNLRNTSCGAVAWAAFHENISPSVADSSLSFGIVIGERFDESNPDHQGRKVYPGHGGFGVVANKWSEIGRAVNLSESGPSFRRKIVRSLGPSREDSLGIRRFKCDIWGFTRSVGTEDKNTGWVKGKDGQINVGFRKLCRVEAELRDWTGVLTQKYTRSKPKDAIELDVIIEASGRCYRAYIEWKEGENRRQSEFYSLG
ncbi:unnamed protein product [Rhizoctonia solani]|uniref:Uncharacterized protein n=1 Tax=Rhizoctonia solani TaxID=456999 RepID=A0A8H3BW95_9AGAM|nr:unnamed protein product [Rhizoctonia solani]